MPTRRPLSLPIILAIVMIALLVVLAVGWVLLGVFGAIKDTHQRALYLVLLSIGSTFIAMLVVGVILYLILSVKAINLSRRQSNFIDSVTHELKSPIASMKLCLQTLSRRQVDQQEQTNFHQFMLEDLDRLDRLINQMLAAGRQESGRGDGDVEDVPLAGLLQDCARTVCLRYRVPPETVQLELQACTVRGRPVDLDIMFRNLIDNAVKYAGAQPRVEVKLRLTHDGRAIVRIADNGRGIPHHLRRRVFGRFERLGLELERDRPGTGLGLYLARNVARRLHGRIRVRDREQGPGTVFEVQLPGKAVEDATVEQ
jgi:signal transduction histidine kinase